MPPSQHTGLVMEGSERASRTITKGKFTLTPEARKYAVKELARRAGVSRDFFRKWRIEVEQEKTIVSFGSDAKGKIYFPHAREALLEQIAAGLIPVSRAAWFQPADKNGDLPDLFLPFCDLTGGTSQPLYAKISEDSLACNADVLASFVWTLSRLEETLSEERDEHKRFPASASIALSHNFLDRPILDEHGRAFEQVLCSLLPSWRPERRAMRVKLTHDIDDIGIPFELRASLGHTLKRRRPSATVRDAVALFTHVNPSELAQVEKLAAISKARGLHSAFYWKASPRSPRDSGYDPSSQKVKRVIHSLKQDGFELGVHPAYNTFGDRPKLAAEIAALRRTLESSPLGGRQHYLRWSPETWRDWEACGLSYDSSLGLADHFGFRAGTAFPYRPWCFHENREMNLIEIPLILMDCTPVKYMKLALQEGLSQIQALIRRTAQAGGVFTLLWHNATLLDPDYDGWYEGILELLRDVPSYGTPPNSQALW